MLSKSKVNVIYIDIKCKEKALYEYWCIKYASYLIFSSNFSQDAFCWLKSWVANLKVVSLSTDEHYFFTF